MPAAREVTYVWSAGSDEVAMHTAYGKEIAGALLDLLWTERRERVA